ncbi:hypothetical protein CQW49_01285 [Methylosinus trichosporium OB3b]|uniref:Uncharacterized protein n=1 Tax=Methylosinus trichosporium (strain ATCC 35070 / NCIMB 11131 / UNIQEM 75 / OB3b) TaxID=595536 RepID=A0A2D2CV30_METT3|nr:hypothetical protein CQW49_01285 [Methylosinus trichosporium OB3b]
MDTRSSRRRIFLLAFLSGIATAGYAFAHDGVKLEQDTCVLKVGPVKVHFIGYQNKGEPQEFCDDIARTGPTVIALSAMELDRLPDSYIVQNQAPAAPSAAPSVDLREIAIGVRIVKDVGEATEFYAPPKIYRNATMTFEHDFREAGKYAAIITVADRDGQEWSGRFPFTVGVFSVWNSIEYILYAIGFVALSAGLWRIAWRGKRPAKPEDPVTIFHQAE